MASETRPDALSSLADAGLRVARTTTTARLAMAGLADVVEPELIAPEVRDRVLAELQAAADQVLVPLGARDVERALRDAWGAKPSDELDDLDLEHPVAVTPTAQVHRGVLDGRDVAVKVLRPGLQDAVRGDMVLLDTLVRPMSAAFPGVDAAAIVREVRERLLDELDLEHEGSTQRAFARA